MEEEEEQSSLVGSSDVDVLKRNHKFVRDDAEDQEILSKNWEARMARRYYDKLYKEYVVADLSRYREGKVGLRWRVESEVISGLGSEYCGGLTCGGNQELNTFEVPFQYAENNEIKAELVKLKLCGKCSKKLSKLREIAKSSSRSDKKRSKHKSKK